MTFTVSLIVFTALLLLVGFFVAIFSDKFRKKAIVLIVSSISALVVISIIAIIIFINNLGNCSQ